MRSNLKVALARLAVIAVVPAVLMLSACNDSASKQQEKINDSTNAWHCVEGYGDQSEC